MKLIKTTILTVLLGATAATAAPPYGLRMPNDPCPRGYIQMQRNLPSWNFGLGGNARIIEGSASYNSGGGSYNYCAPQQRYFRPPPAGPRPIPWCPAPQSRGSSGRW